MKAKATTLVSLAMAVAMAASPAHAAPARISADRPAAQTPSGSESTDGSSPLEVNANTPSDVFLSEGVPQDWWSAVQEQIQNAEYAITWQEQTALADLPAAYQAPNRAQNLRTYFTPQGIRVLPRMFDGEAPPWEWGLTLTGYGAEDAPQPVQAATLAADGNRIEYSRGPVTEWYVNDERGLKQGFTLHGAPPAAGGAATGATIVLALALSGPLQADLADAGGAVALTTPGGVQVLRYADLLARDAAGRELPARIALSQGTIRLVIDAADAVYPITVDPLASTPNWSVESNQDSAQLGWSVGTAGDVNGDGYADVIVGAPTYDNGQADEGRAYAYHGGTSGLSATAAWTAEIDQAGALYGASVGTAGDVNGDGYADVLVGAPNYDNGQSDEGAAFVYHGGAAGLSATAVWTAESNQADAWFGWSVGTAGDVNGDGYGDVIVGAPLFDNGQSDEGVGFVYHGGAGGLNATAAWTAESNHDTGWVGASVGTAGDVNGDGYADVLVGAPLYDNGQSDEGAAFVYHGGPAGLSATADWSAEGNQDSAQLGWSVGTAGDVNGDGYADIVVGAPDYDNGQSEEGRAYAYHGGAGGLSATAAWTAESDQAGARLGISVGTAGDVNGDGYADVLVGAPNYDNGQNDEGAAFVYHGGAVGLSAMAVWMAESDQADAQLGWSVGTAGDVNGDGYADVLVGAPLYDNGQSDEGRAHAYHGGAAGLSASAAWAAEGNQASAGFGWSVGMAGDVNGDGYADVLVGAPYYDNGQGDEGAAFVYYGSASGLSATAAWTAEGDQNYAQFGNSVGTAGDVNGDGYADVIVGAPTYDKGQGDEGRIFVYHGGAAGLNATAAWTAESDQTDAQFGFSVGTAGDVNGDGYADVIVGARLFDNGQTDEGRAFVYHGGAAGLSATVAWTAEGDQADAQLGWSARTAGDVNGDGYADVLVGAPFYDNGQSDEGRAFVYHGGAGGLSATAAWTAESNQDNAQLGYSVGTAGDVNGDGYADVVVGAPLFDNGQSDEGRAFVYHGGAAGLNVTAVWMVEGDKVNAQLGWSVGTAGDVNGDGYADVIVGASLSANGQTYEGRAYVYHGGVAGLSAAAAWTAECNQVHAQLGWSVGMAGDVNGDGYADVVVGAPLFDNGQNNEGAAFVYHGGATGLSTTAAWTAESHQDGAFFGSSVGTAGDVNGDGYADVIVGASSYDNGQSDEGRAYIYYGGAGGLSTSAAWAAESDQPFAYFGNSVGTAGDVNGDGYADVIVGARFYDNGQSEEGRAFVYQGSAAGLSTSAAWTAESDQDGAYFGNSVGTAGDVNGDGCADVVVGAPNYDNGQSDEGRTYVYHGGAGGLSATAAWMAESNQAGAQFGWPVGTAGDVNGDGYADVIVGAYKYDNGQSDEGRAFVYQGSAGGLSATAVWSVESDQSGAQFGISVGTAGDVNGDGYADVIVGAFLCDNGQSDEGCAFVYHGGAGGLSASAAWVVESNRAGAQFGWSVGTAGDVNGDGYADVLVGAPGYDNGQSYEGRAYAYHGRAVGLSATAAWTTESDQTYAQFGNSVGTAGDVNGDGYADVIVGALLYDNGQSDEGGAFVYYGNAGAGKAVRPQQRRADDSAPVASGGQVISPTQARLAALARTPFGRSSVRLELEIKPEGAAFTGSGLGFGPWTDSGLAGVDLNHLVGELSFETRYHWRLRIAGRPLHATAQSAATYRSGWYEGATFLTALSGQQAIAGAGQTNLLGQAAYVNVSSLGSPPLTGLSLRGYPNTLPPNAASMPGYGNGTGLLGRYASLEPNAGAAGYALTLCLNYDDAEAAAAGATEADLQLCRWAGTAWACAARGAGSSASANLVCAGDVSQLSHWAIAQVRVLCVDFNQSGRVDVQDIMQAAARWNNSAAYSPLYDAAAPFGSPIDVLDIAAIAGRWNTVCP